MPKRKPQPGELRDEPEAAPEEREPRQFDGRPLKVLLEVVRVSQRELSRRVGFTEKRITQIANGDRALDRSTAEDLARGLGVPLMAFKEAQDFLDCMDRLRGEGGVWIGGQWQGIPGKHVLGGEVADDPTALRQWQEYLEVDRLAEFSGRAVREIVLRLLSQKRGLTYEDL